MEVTDTGVIRYSKWVSDGYRWDKASVHRSAYQYSCETALPLLEKGFVTYLSFKGKGGSTQQYDLNRCEQEAQN